MQHQHHPFCDALEERKKSHRIMTQNRRLQTQAQAQGPGHRGQGTGHRTQTLKAYAWQLDCCSLSGRQPSTSPDTVTSTKTLLPPSWVAVIMTQEHGIITVPRAFASENRLFTMQSVAVCCCHGHYHTSYTDGGSLT